MSDYLEIFRNAFVGYARYLGQEITTLHWANSFYWLIGISLAVYSLELMFPWRRDQPRVRKDFWLDGFYMFFNYFLLSLVGFAAVSEVVVVAFRDALREVGIDHLVAVEIGSWPAWAQIGALFLLRDFVHYWIHRLLHRVPRLWEFHKVHHSVEQMGFAAHLRFHWMESVVYRSLQYLPLAAIGFGIDDFLWANVVATAIGHLNHANLRLPLGPLRFVLNNPQMHIWHHARDLPEGRRFGMNFGLSLACWDYLFGTACIPSDGRDIPLGFPGVERFPGGFAGQVVHGLRRLR